MFYQTMDGLKKALEGRQLYRVDVGHAIYSEGRPNYYQGQVAGFDVRGTFDGDLFVTVNISQTNFQLLFMIISADAIERLSTFTEDEIVTVWCSHGVTLYFE